MARLTLEKARDLAKVFGEMTPKETVLLLLFQEPHSKYEILKMMEDVPKAYRIPRASLYRKVDELEKTFFVESVNKREFEKGSLKETIYFYKLTYKGFLATYIYTYLLFLDPKTSDGMQKWIKSNKLEKIESLPATSYIISFLRWHRKRGINLRPLKIDLSYFTMTLMSSMLDYPEDISEKDILDLAKITSKFGLTPQHDPKQFLPLLHKVKKSFPEFEKILTTLAERDKEESSKGDSKT